MESRRPITVLDLILERQQAVQKQALQVAPQPEFHPGDLCPQCQMAELNYDGLLNLVCPNCGYALGGCFT